MSDRINIICNTPPASPLLPEPPYTCCMCGERFENESIAFTHICRDATRTLDQYSFEAFKTLLPGWGSLTVEGQEDAGLARLMALVDKIARAKVEQRRALTEAMWQGRKAVLQDISAKGREAGDEQRKANGDAPAVLGADGLPLIYVPPMPGVQ